MVDSINRTRPITDIQQQGDLADLIAREQERISTGRSFNRPSEAPTSWLEISSISRQSAINDSWLSNVSRARILGQQAESTLDTMASGAARARELMVLASNETLAPQDREIIALEMENLHDQFIQLADARDSYDGQLFHNGNPIQIRVDNNVLLTPTPNLDAVTGSVALEAGGTAALTQIMNDTIDAVRTGTAAERATQLDQMDDVNDHFAALLADQGLLLNRLDDQQSRIEEARLNATERRATLENVDVAEALSRFQSLLVNLEAAQRLYAQSSSASLFRLVS